MLRLGTDATSNEPIFLTSQARRQGVYVIGTTGTGKTTLLQNIAYQDMCDPSHPALIVLDPHGDFTDDLLARVPDNRQDDVILFAPADDDQIEQPLGLNLLSCDRTNPLERRLVSSTVVDTLRKLFWYSWGPRMEDLLRHSVLTLMETPGTTLLELLLMLVSEEHRQPLTANLSDPVLRQFWQRQFAAYGKRELVEVVGSSLNKIGRFLVDPVIRNVVCQSTNAFDLQEIMDEGKILLVNLSKGNLGEENSALLGSVLVNLVLVAALRRREIRPSKRRPVHLIVDEYQSFATESFPTLQSEARKYGIDVIVAHQYREQLDDLNKGSTLNVANFIVMRVSGRDSAELATQFDNTPPPPERRYEPVRFQSENFPDFYEQRTTLEQEVDGPRRLYSDVAAEQANALSILPNYRARVRLVDDTGRLIEHNIETITPQGEENLDRTAAIRAASAALGQPKREVEEVIERRIGDVVFDEIPRGEPLDPHEYQD